jgi:hypothetical protein
MVVKATLEYGERFSKGLEWVGLLAVKKTWLTCPYKVTVRRPSATATSSAFRPTGNSFWSLDSSKWLLTHLLSMENDFQKDWSELVCWLWRKLGWRVLENKI